VPNCSELAPCMPGMPADDGGMSIVTPGGARSPAYTGYLEQMRPTADEGSSVDSSCRGGEGCISFIMIRSGLSHAVNLEDDKDVDITNFRLRGGGDPTEDDNQYTAVLLRDVGIFGIRFARSNGRKEEKGRMKGG
jgi:hypothetical protein